MFAYEIMFFFFSIPLLISTTIPELCVGVVHVGQKRRHLVIGSGTQDPKRKTGRLLLK